MVFLSKNKLGFLGERCYLRYMGKKKKIPQIVKDIRAFNPRPIDYSYQKNISYSQFSLFHACPKRWSLHYKEGHKVFNSSIHTVFGTAIHEVLQHYLDVMYEKSGAEADRINTHDLFQDTLRKEYAKQYKANKNKHFSDPVELRQFFEEGLEIIRDFAKNKGKHFSKKGWWLVGCEIPVQLAPDSDRPNVIYKGFLDIVMYHEPTDTFKIIDIKTSKSGWRDNEKKDELKQFQLILYKKYLSTIFNIKPESIEIEYLIVKRQVWESDDFVIKRIQKFSPPSGKTKMKRASVAIQEFLDGAFDYKSRYKEVSHKPTPHKYCNWCPYHKTHLCKATF